VDSKDNKNIESAEIVLPCSDLNETLEFFTEKLEFQIIAIFPADNPSVAVISGFGLRLRLEKTDQNAEANKNIRIRLNCNLPTEIANGELEFVAPNGVNIELVEANPTLILPELKPTFVLNKFSDDADWIRGRAGMRYRDLIPDRQGGRFIASHIHIPVGGEVPDYPHFHKIHFQMIYCYKGWAKLVYEDQGEPFIFNAGDCVLQPPQIRHRVLESSDNLEVIEVSCPAEHETYSDHEMILPTSHFNPERDFNGQRFSRHISTKATWENWRMQGFECRDTGIGSATKGLASVKIIHPISVLNSDLHQHNAEFVFIFILQGKASLKRGNDVTNLLNFGDSLVITSGMIYGFSDCSDDLEILEITLPAEFSTEIL
jgi:quercetin dioxygenase-like cupin family protein